MVLWNHHRKCWFVVGWKIELISKSNKTHSFPNNNIKWSKRQMDLQWSFVLVFNICTMNGLTVSTTPMIQLETHCKRIINDWNRVDHVNSHFRLALKCWCCYFCCIFCVVTPCGHLAYESMTTTINEHDPGDYCLPLPRFTLVNHCNLWSKFGVQHACTKHWKHIVWHWSSMVFHSRPPSVPSDQ